MVYRLLHAKSLIEDWRQNYNVQRPHRSLGNLAPVKYALRSPGLAQVTGGSVALEANPAAGELS